MPITPCVGQAQFTAERLQQDDQSRVHPEIAGGRLGWSRITGDGDVTFVLLARVLIFSPRMRLGVKRFLHRARLRPRVVSVRSSERRLRHPLIPVLAPDRGRGLNLQGLPVMNLSANRRAIVARPEGLFAHARQYAVMSSALTRSDEGACSARRFLCSLGATPGVPEVRGRTAVHPVMRARW